MQFFGSTARREDGRAKDMPLSMFHHGERLAIRMAAHGYMTLRVRIHFANYQGLIWPRQKVRSKANRATLSGIGMRIMCL